MACFGTPGILQTEEDVQTFDKGFLLIYAGLPSFITKKYTAARDRIVTVISQILKEGLPTTAHPVILARDKTMQQEGFGTHDRASFITGFFYGVLSNLLKYAFWVLAYTLHVPNDDFNRILTACRGCTDSDTPAPNLTQLTQTTHLTSLLTETHRHVSSTLSIRVAQSNTTITTTSTSRTFTIREGDLVCLPARVVHKDADVFGCGCGEFNAGRFVGEEGKERVFEKGGKVVRKPVAAFGGGASLCPGRHFASLATKSFLCTILTLFDITPLEPIPGVDMTAYGS
ncbi:hypothetical protein HK104_005370, partial [Borealophlyctis nickersoniae]